MLILKDVRDRRVASCVLLAHSPALPDRTRVRNVRLEHILAPRDQLPARHVLPVTTLLTKVPEVAQNVPPETAVRTRKIRLHNAHPGRTPLRDRHRALRVLPARSVHIGISHQRRVLRGRIHRVVRRVVRLALRDTLPASKERRSAVSVVLGSRVRVR